MNRQNFFYKDGSLKASIVRNDVGKVMSRRVYSSKGNDMIKESETIKISLYMATGDFGLHNVNVLEGDIFYGYFMNDVFCLRFLSGQGNFVDISIPKYTHDHLIENGALIKLWR